MNKYDSLIIGGGPAGLACAIACHKKGLKVLLLERENELGGILKQCIHDGFGLIRFKERLTGPEYVQRFIDEFINLNINYHTLSFVTKTKKINDQYQVTYVNQNGVTTVIADNIVIATGCRERTAKQIAIHGTRPSGVYTAGCAQHFTNLLGQLPTKRCVILGSGDIGLIMARRLTLEGAKVIGVYEAKSTPSGLARNLAQCLDDYDIPLYLSHTVTKVYGTDRLTSVEVCQVDEKMQPIKDTKQIIQCDSLILSVGLIPENEISQSLGVPLDNKTKGPLVDQHLQTTVDHIYVCGNAMHVNDLVDYVSLSGEIVGDNQNIKNRELINIEYSNNFLYALPQLIDINHLKESLFFFRSNKDRKKAELKINIDGEEVFKKIYTNLKPPEMETLKLDLSKYSINKNTKIQITLEDRT
ncbi:MAG: NAD(P)/FAD-dependent oxidoreductase [Erysipelotrichaceae bacterium]